MARTKTMARAKAMVKASEMARVRARRIELRNGQ